MKTFNAKNDVKNFRCDKSIMDKAIARATDKGMNFSEYVRWLIHKDLEDSEKKESVQA